MGVDIDAVAGIGVRVTDEHLKAAGYNKKRCDGCVDDCGYCDEGQSIGGFLDDLGIQWGQYVSCCTGKTNYVWLVPGKKYLEIVKNTPDFLKALNEKGVKVTENDLELILVL